MINLLWRDALAGLYQIVIPTPYKAGPVNCYLSLTDPITLIDTGIKSAESGAALQAELTALGRSLRDIQRVIVTHAHADHYGQAAAIVHASQAEVWTHRHNRLVLEAYETTRARRNEFYEQVLIEAGVPPEQRRQISGDRRSADPYAEAVKVDRTLAEGDEVELAGRMWQVYHTPGHAGGLICLFEPQSRILLSNDHLLRDISSNPVLEPDPDGGPRPHRLVQYLHHLQRMADLNPLIAWPGHGQPIHEVHALVRQRLQFHERRARRLWDAIGAAERSVYQLAEPLLGRLRGGEVFLALSEMIGHLDWLEEQGRVEAVQREGIVYWRRS